MKTLRQYIGIGIACILLYFLIQPFVETHTEVKASTFEIQWFWLLCSFGAILFYWSAYLSPFATLLSGMRETRVRFVDAWRLFHLANITRYLPGRIWGFVRLLSLSERFGLSKTAVGSALTLHVGIETALGGLIGVSLIFSEPIRETAKGVFEAILATDTLLLTIAVVGLLIVFVFLLATVSSKAREFLKTLRATGSPLFSNPFGKMWLSVFVSHFLLWVCQGMAFFLFVKSIVPAHWRDAYLLAAIFAFAWIVGFLSFLTPGGLGIREGILGMLLANYMPASQATLVALLCRVWILSAEILLAGIAFLLHRSCYERQTEVDNI